MSEELPPRPSLNHLRKQAKELLKRLGEQNPHARLVEAQHALARQYGFDSWPKLKAHVEVAAKEAPPRPQIFERLTQKAKESLFFSRYEASAITSMTIEPEHILLGLMRVAEGLRGRLFEGAALSLDSARAEVKAACAATPTSATIIIPFSERTKRVFRDAVEEADRLKHPSIGIVHVLLGVMREHDSVAAGIVARAGIDANGIRTNMPRLLDEEPK